jgi:hypothetical protein
MASQDEFRNFMRRLRVGDTARIDVARSSGRRSVAVVVTGYDQVVARVTPDPSASERQLRLRAAWLRGDP